MSVELVPGRPRDCAAIRQLLELADLPTADLSPDMLRSFLVAHAPDGAVVGAIGLEVYGRVGLLRSLVVHPSQRGRGLGSLLVEHLERRAAAAGMTDVYLLTTTAASFFAARGYRPLNRTEVPPEVAASEEFRILCPTSAVCMIKWLAYA